MEKKYPKFYRFKEEKNATKRKQNSSVKIRYIVCTISMVWCFDAFHHSRLSVYWRQVSTIYNSWPDAMFKLVCVRACALAIKNRCLESCIGVTIRWCTNSDHYCSPILTNIQTQITYSLSLGTTILHMFSFGFWFLVSVLFWQFCRAHTEYLTKICCTMKRNSVMEDRWEYCNIHGHYFFY